MYPYHNEIKKRIRNGELTGYEFVASYKNIGECLLLYFSTYPFERPIRPHKYHEYTDILAEWNRKRRQKMTPERALEIIKDELTVESGIINEALKIVENAVEKQMPKKPNEFEIYDECTDYSYPTALCPKCNCEVDTNFCYNCGQAIDWRDEECVNG